MSLYLGNTVISGVAAPIDGSIAIGQIISSIIPLTDAGLHLLDGALIQGGGIYDDFVQYIAGLSSSYPQCFTDEATWQNTVNNKGVCGKFVYNSTNNTVRLPKIIGFIEGTVDSNALGDLVEAGLPNITGFTDWWSYGTGANNPTGAFYSTLSANNSPDPGSNPGQLLSFDASRSSSIYGNSNTVQPQSIKVFYYIVIATTTKTDIEVDIDEVVTDLNTLNGQITNISSTLSNKANDVDVVHKTGYEIISGTKTFTGTQYLSPQTLITKENNSDEGGQITFEKATNSTLKGNPYIDIYQDTMRFITIDSNNNAQFPLTINCNDGTFTSRTFQVVSALPVSPNANVFYFIPE